MASDYTTYFNLDKYVGADKPNLRDQYNAAMDKVDAALKTNETDISSLGTTVSIIGARLPTSAFDETHTVAQALVGKASQADLTTVENKVTNLETILPSTDFSAASTVKDALDAKATTTALNNEITNRQTAVQNEVTARETAVQNEATARANADTALSNRIDAISIPSNPYQGKKFICVTDSWGSENSNNVTRCWMHQVVEDAFEGTYVDLHYGSTGYVYAGQGGTFLTRLTNWALTHAEEIPTIDYIMVCGSPNDYQSAPSTIATAVKQFVDYALSTFTNAKVIIVPQFTNYNMGLTSINSGSGGTNPWVNGAAGAEMAYRDNYMLNNRVECLAGVMYSLIGGSGYFNSDYVHPNQSGHNFLAKQVYLKLTTGHVRPLKFYVVPKGIQAAADWNGGSGSTDNNKLSDYAVGCVQIIDGTMLASFTGSVTSNITGGLFIGFGVIPLNDVGNVCPCGSTAVTNGTSSKYGAFVGRGFVDNYPYNASNDGKNIPCAWLFRGEAAPAQGDKFSASINQYLELI